MGKASRQKRDRRVLESWAMRVHGDCAITRILVGMGYGVLLSAEDDRAQEIIESSMERGAFDVDAMQERIKTDPDLAAAMASKDHHTLERLLFERMEDGSFPTKPIDILRSS